jgi:hypothetical protein
MALLVLYYNTNRDYDPSSDTPRFSPVYLEPKSFMDVIQDKVNKI